MSLLKAEQSAENQNMAQGPSASHAYEGSSSKNSRGETSTSKSKVIDPIDQNEVGEKSRKDNEEWVDINIIAVATTENETTPKHVVIIQEEVVLIETTPNPQQISGSTLKLEIAKCIVYGGLTELFASLGMVTSAAATNAKTEKLVASSLASLITRFFVLSYIMSKVWLKKQESGGDETEEEKSERYENVFGDRKNYCIHFSVALLSLVLFGLIPPLVYGFTFREPGKDQKLKYPTVTIITVLCIGLLGVVKAYIEGKSNCVEFVNIIGNCVVDALGTTVITTLGGDLIGNYIEKFDWSGQPNKANNTIQTPCLSFENGTSPWGRSNS